VGVALLDTSAVIGFLDRGDAFHRDAVTQIEELLRAGMRLAISAITWSETLSGALQGHQHEDAVREFLEDFSIAVLAVDRTVAERAAALQAAYAATGPRRERRRLRTPDALILATATLDDDIDVVIGADGQWAGVPGVGDDLVVQLTAAAG
jgi:predicted nucleic acid-binding protein